MSDENRRRLLRALSAAPVVMSLRPGSALANSSAHQCLKNLGPHTDPDPKWIAQDAGTICGTGDGDCHAYEQMDYWELRAATSADKPWVQQCLNNNAGPIVKLPAGYCQINGAPMYTQYNVQASQEWVGGFEQLCIRKRRNNGSWTNWKAISNGGKKNGHFMVKGELDDPQNPTHFIQTGVWPEPQGDHGITASCMSSVNMGGGNNWTFAKN